MIVAVTGATGIVGEFLLPALLAGGFHVRAMVHRTTPEVVGIEPHANLQWIPADLADVDSLLRLTDGCDAVVHAAFEHVVGRYRGGEGDDPASFQAVNFDQTKQFFNALQDADIKRSIFISSRAVFDGYAENHDSIGDGAKTQPTSLYGEIKARTESFGNAIERIGFTTLRPTGVYGIRNRPTLSKWWDLVKRTLQGSASNKLWSDQLKTEVHGNDVAGAIALLLRASDSQVEGKAFNCSDVAISEVQLVEIARTIANGDRVDRLSLSRGKAPLNPMSCEGLNELDWKPSGFSQVEKTIRGLVDYQRG